MIDRFPEGTDSIPFPHKVFNWKRGNRTLTVELNPREHSRTNPPQIPGWEPFFIGFHGYDKPMHYSYREVACVM